VVVAVVVGREVESGVAVEETVGSELEADVGDRHYRPVFGADHVVGGEGVPEDQVGVFQRPVGRGPGGQAVAAGVLIGVAGGMLSR